jgi:uncharacterized protein YndB with AHSA1/START domain
MSGVAGSVSAVPITLDQCIDVAAPADRLWDLVSTSEGLSGWFVDATVVPGPQGSVTLRFAPGAEGTVPILAWDPPRRIRFGTPEGVPGRVHEFTVTPTAQGARLELRDEGVIDAETETTVAGWTGFLGQLQALAEAGS